MQVTFSTGLTLNYIYDSARRVTQVTNQLGETIKYTYDPAGNRLSESISGSAGITYLMQQAFDELSRVIQIVGAQNKASQHQYDPNSNLVQSINPRNYSQKQSFDVLNRLTQTTEANQAKTTFTYDQQNRLTSVTDAQGYTTTYIYDAFDNLIQKNSPDTGITHYSYDEANNLIQKTDARGIVVNYSYDALNRIIQVQYPSAAQENITYTYDAGTYGVGKLTSIQDESGTTTYRYNYRGQMIQRTSQILSETFVLGYDYAANGQLIAIHYPSGLRIQHTRDSLGRISAITAEHPDGRTQSLALDISYLPFGPLNAFTYGNGLDHLQSFDQDYRLTQIKISDVLARDYIYDANSNILSITTTESSLDDQSFTYNSVDRISYASGSEGQRRYNYDLVGNRTQFQLTQGAISQLNDYHYIANRLDQITGNDNRTYQYDANGNPLQESSTQTLESIYNRANRLSSVNTQNGLVSYLYNAMGQRVAKTLAGQTTYFIYGESGQLLFEQSQDNKAYVYLQGQPLAMISSQSQASQATDTFYLQNKSTGYRIAAPSSTSGDRLITVSGAANTPEAQFRKVTRNDAYFFFQNVATGFYMRPISNADGSTLEQVPNTYTGHRTQWFDALSTDGNFLYLRNRWTGKNIRPINKILGNQIEIRPTSWRGDWTQWELVPTLESKPDSTEIHYFHNDHLGTPQVLTNQAGEVDWKASYTPFGNGNLIIENIENNLRFAGQYFDGETGKHYNYFRDYDPTTGRYIQSDPLGLYDGPNTYLYAQANPLSYIDPLGLASSGKTVNLGGGTTVRVDNPHVPGQQQHAHVKTPKGEAIINKDGTPSHKGKGSSNNITNKAKKFLKGKGFKLPGFPLLLNPCLLNPHMPGCRKEPNHCPEA